MQVPGPGQILRRHVSRAQRRDRSKVCNPGPPRTAFAPDGYAGLRRLDAAQVSNIHSRGKEALTNESAEDILADHTDEPDSHTHSSKVERRYGARSTQDEASIARQFLLVEFEWRRIVE